MKKNGTIEFFRFVFCCAVCVHHFKGYGNPNAFNGGYLGVDVFFVISGYFLMQHYTRQRDADEKHPEKSAFTYMKGRIARVFPHHLFSWICMAIVSAFVVKNITLKAAFTEGWWELLLLKATGLGNDISVNGVSWYLSAMVGSSFLIYWLLCAGRNRRGKDDFYVYVLASVAFFAVMQRLWENPGHLNGWVQSGFLFTIGFWRGFAEMGLGCITFYVITQLKSHIKPTLSLRVFATVFEIVGWGLVLKHMWYGWNRKDFSIPIIVALLIISCFLCNSYLTKILDNPVSIFLGKISFPMYLNQRIIQNPIKELFPGHSFWPATFMMMAALFLFSLGSQALVDGVSSKVCNICKQRWIQSENIQEECEQ